MSMRIAYLVNQYPLGSHSFIRREILALERQGFEIERISLRAWDAPLVDPADKAERVQTRYVLQAGTLGLLSAVTFMLIVRPFRFFRALRLALRMGRGAQRSLPVHIVYLAEACRIVSWLRNSDVSHIHAHFGTNSAEVAMLVRALGGPTWSFTAHGQEEFDNTLILKMSEKVKHSSFVVAISSFGRSQLFRVLPRECWRKVHVVHCGLDRVFLDEGENVPATAKQLVCVGRFGERKGHQILIDSVRLLVNKGIAFELVLVGDGEARADIEALIREYGLARYVRLTGWLSEAEVKNEILAARALVQPSFAEGIPVVLMEAMALHRPVIGTYVGGIPELVHPGKHGWLVPPGDAEQLANAMRECLDAPSETLMRMGKAARERVLDRHNVDDQARQLAHLFETIVNG